MSTRALGAFLLLTALAVGPAPAGAERDAAVSCRDRAVAAVQARYEGVRDVSARFEQSTRPVGMGSAPREPVVSRGEVVLAKPGKMRWTYEEPEPSVVVSDGKTLWLYDPSFGEVQKVPAGEGFLTGAVGQFLLGAGDMRRDFEVRAVSCTPEAAELELVPREPSSYEKVTLRVDPEAGDVRRTTIVDLLGNLTSVEFRELRFNTGPDAAVFRFEAPAGVRVIELSP